MRLRFSWLFPLIVCGAVLLLAIDAPRGEPNESVISGNGWLAALGIALGAAWYGRVVDRRRREEERGLGYDPRFRPSNAGFLRLFGAIALLGFVWGTLRNLYFSYAVWQDGLATAGAVVQNALIWGAILLAFLGVAVWLFLAARRMENEQRDLAVRDRNRMMELIAELQSAPDFTVCYPFARRKELWDPRLGEVEEMLRRIADCTSRSAGAYRLKESLRKGAAATPE